VSLRVCLDARHRRERVQPPSLVAIPTELRRLLKLHFAEVMDFQSFKKLLDLWDSLRPL
jgi:hypothetical protein